MTRTDGHPHRPEKVLGGFTYWVSGEDLEAFSKLTDLQRLTWLDEARRFSILASTPRSAEIAERLRRGE